MTSKIPVVVTLVNRTRKSVQALGGGRGGGVKGGRQGEEENTVRRERRGKWREEKAR